MGAARKGGALGVRCRCIGGLRWVYKCTGGYRWVYRCRGDLSVSLLGGGGASPATLSSEQLLPVHRRETDNCQAGG